LNVLAIPGLGGGSYFFDGLAERLQPDYDVIAVDLPVSTPGFTMATWVDELGTLVAERATEPVVLLGHSMGTMLVLEAWRAWPERIRALVFVGGVPQVAPRIRERLTDRLNELQGARDLIGWGKRVAAGVFSPTTLRDRPDIVARFEREFDNQAVGVYVRSCQILLGANTEAIAATVGVPCRGITGEHDQYAPPDAVEAFLRRIPTQPTLDVIPDSAHLPFFEQPDTFAAAVKSFLRTC
jgi:pimeloyl-ACP methyl ester carboxylesterase